MSHKAVTLAYKYAKSRGLARFVLVTLADHCNGKQKSFTCWPSLETLRDDTGISKRHVCRILDYLEKVGDMTRSRSTGGRNRRTLYTITVGPNSDIRTPLNGDLEVTVRKNQTVTSETLNSDLGVTRNKPEGTGKKRRGAKCAPNGAGAPFTPSVDNSFSEKKKSKPAGRPPATTPPEFAPTVERVIGRMNQLAGTRFKTDSKLVVNGIVRRLRDGATEQDCNAVVESRWSNWMDDSKMRQYFNPETLFRETNFDKYLNAARMDAAASDTKSAEWRKRTFING